MAMKDLVPTLHRKRKHLPSLHNREADPLAQIQTDMNRLFDELFAVTGAPADWPEFDTPAALRVNVSEDEKEVKVTAELPGMDEKDVHVEMDDNSVTISGEKQEEETEKKRSWHRRELRYGSFHRVVALPSQVDGSNAKARFRKGVLTITAPKREPKAPRKSIEIQSD